MSKDLTDLLKVLVATALVFAVATTVMLYVIFLLSQYGANLPMIGSLPLSAPPEMVPVIANDGLFRTLAAVHVTAAGLALLMTSHTIDMALLITSKAVTVVIAALIGFAGGHMVYLQLTENTALALSSLVPALIALGAFLMLSSLLSLHNLRQLGNLRFAVAIALLIMGPMLLIWL